MENSKSLTSAIYTGTVDELKPIAIPRMKRPAMRRPVELAKPIVSEPIVKTTLEIRMIFLRPVENLQRLELIANFLRQLV